MTFKKIIATLFSCLIFTNAFALQLSSDLQEIVKDGKLTVAFVSSPTNTQLQGFDMALATLIASELSITLDPIYTTHYDDAVALVANKKAEMAISNITRTPERGKYVLFSRPYNINYLAAIESRSNAKLTDMSRNQLIEKYNQPGMIIGAATGAVFSDIAQDYFPKAKTVTYEDEKQMLLDIENKKINVALTDNVLGRIILKSAPEFSLSVTQTTVNDWVLEDAIVMNSKHIHLMFWIDLLLETFENDGTLRNLRAQYFNNTVVK